MKSFRLTRRCLPGLTPSRLRPAQGPGRRWLSTVAGACLAAVLAGWPALLAGGGYAEKVAVPAGQLLPAPASTSLTHAAGLPETVCTVYSNVFLGARLRAGETLLIHGGASGIGTTAIQLAKDFGATVAVTAGSEDRLKACRELGADIAINHRDEDFVQRVKDNPTLGAVHLTGIIAAQGALPIKVGEETIGAAGVSGAPGGDKDEACAQAGLAKINDRLQ